MDRQSNCRHCRALYGVQLVVQLPRADQNNNALNPGKQWDKECERGREGEHGQRQCGHGTTENIAMLVIRHDKCMDRECRERESEDERGGERGSDVQCPVANGIGLSSVAFIAFSRNLKCSFWFATVTHCA